MQAILDRFRNDTIRTFAKHDMKVTNFWVVVDESSKCPRAIRLTNTWILYELRVYDVNLDKMKVIQERLRDHVVQLFMNYGMKVTQFWEDLNEANNRLYYVVEHANMEMRNLNYDRFRNDPEWIEVKRISELDGPLVNKQERFSINK
ncbi:NIPSNAP family protein [Paenibacillus sp. V4I3]|uniref:NIPSNAP family protein n=1 Tax=Paenibacillus sp. V4I3 TaxID=3042305 RepID=UPI0027D78D72|nr:NIPSNAP family protein [Paenibacillus sp. V4I3]